MEDEGGDGGFGVHHVAFGELDADLVGLEDAPERGLIGEVGAGGVTEGYAEAPVVGLELVADGEVRRVGEAPERT